MQHGCAHQRGDRTVAGNTATAIGGGGILEATINTDGTPSLPGNALTLKLSLVTDNTATDGGGIYAVPGSPVTFTLTLIAKNTPDHCAPSGSISFCKN